MITSINDLQLLENLTEQQHELLNTFHCMCETVDDCTCDKNLKPEAMETLRVQLALLQQELERSKELTAELTQHVTEENALTEVACEDFEYWSR